MRRSLPQKNIRANYCNGKPKTSPPANGNRRSTRRDVTCVPELVQTVELQSAVDDAFLLNDCHQPGWTNLSHNAAAIHRGFSNRMWETWKHEPILSLSTPDFQDSQNCRPGFLKLDTLPSCCMPNALPGFPLFLVELLLLLALFDFECFLEPLLAHSSELKETASAARIPER